MVAVISNKWWKMMMVILRGSRDRCVSPFSPNSKALKIMIYNVDVEMILSVNGLVIKSLLSQA